MPLINPQNLLASPLGMAGLGLLAQPTRSRYPVNPMAAVMGGLQAAGQYQQNQAITEGQQQELQMRQQRYQFEMDEALRQREKEAVQQAEDERQKAAYQQWIATRPPEEQAIYSVNPQAAYGKFLEQQFAKPAGPQSSVGKLAADLQAADPTLTPQAALTMAEQKTAELKRAGASSVTMYGENQFKVPNGYMMAPDGNGVVPIPGGPTDPNTPKPVGAEVQAMNIGMSALEKGLGDYVAAVEGFNPRNPADWANPEKRATLESMRANIVLQAKEMQRLGALTGPDVAILDQMLTDPVSMKGAFFGQGGLKAQIDEYRKIIDNRRAATNEETGRSTNPVSASGAIIPSQPKASNVVNWSDL